MQVALKNSAVSAQVITSGMSVMLSIWMHSDATAPQMLTTTSVSGIDPDAADKLADALRDVANQCRMQRADSERLANILEAA